MVGAPGLDPEISCLSPAEVLDSVRIKRIPRSAKCRVIAAPNLSPLNDRMGNGLGWEPHFDLEQMRCGLLL